MAVEDLRLSVKFYSDMKIKRLRNIHGSDGVVGLQKLWIFAATQRQLGVLYDIVDEEIALITDVNAPEFLETLIRLNLVARTADGWLEIVNWEKHQTWVIGAPKRSEKAKKAAKARWENGPVSAGGKNNAKQ